MSSQGKLSYVLTLIAVLSLGACCNKPADPSGFETDLLHQINAVEKQIMALEQAMPQEKFTWRPASGVRSVSEVYMHIAFSNYGLLNIMGFDPPADVKLTGDIRSDVARWDSSNVDKAAIVGILKTSMDHLKATLPKVTDLEKKIDFFGQQVTMRNMLLTILAHLHEHFGQSIAYARMNGVVPPWSAGG